MDLILLHAKSHHGTDNMKLRNKQGMFIPNRIEKQCLKCGFVMQVKPSLLERTKYCSKRCYSQAMIGKYNPESIKKAAIKNKGKKRNEEFKKLASIRQTGVTNSNWNGGWTLDPKEKDKRKQISRYGRLRAEILKEKDYKCEICGLSEEENSKKYQSSLNIHHKNGVGRGSKSPDNRNSNIMVLCHQCHSKLHAKQKPSWY